MAKKIFVFTLFIIGTFFYCQAQDSLINQLLKNREKDYLNYVHQRDSIKVRTWEKVVMLNGLAAKVIQSDSILIAACLDQLSSAMPSIKEQQLLDTITRLKGRIDYLKISTASKNELSPRDYLILLIVSFVLILLGIFALILLRKLQKANRTGQKTKEELETFKTAQIDYEKKLEEINAELSQIYGEREELLKQITELNKALIAEKQNSNHLKGQFERILTEKQEIQNKLNDIEEQVILRTNLPDEATINEMITENNLLKSENIQLKEKIMELQENLSQIKLELEKANESSNEIIIKAIEEREQKFKMELQKLQQMQFQLEDKLKEGEEKLKKLGEERDMLAAERNFAMESLASIKEELEKAKSQLQHLKSEKSELEEQIAGLSALRQQIDALNAEIIRWHNQNEDLQHQLAREIKLRKEIESDIQKIFSRLEGGV